ncbi:MAG: HAD-IC family P-type ATPase [Clostridia bacterium]|nr:HAD-IC family P-type ATPase [Clostridia bacterium]
MQPDENKNKELSVDDIDDEIAEEKETVFTKLVKKFPSAKEMKMKKAERLAAEVERVFPDQNEGLTSAQVQDRIEKGCVNKATKKYSKTYWSIFKDNLCTFFNLMCLIAAIALILAHAPLSQFGFIPIFSFNIIIGIVQEIRAKRKIDKLSILSSPYATVVRDKKQQEIPVNQIVLDDILILKAGQQVPADCIALDGNAEVNEALLTGESVPIKKDEGELLYAGSFIASGTIAVRVEKIGSATYISKLTARAKKYKRPHSEIMDSINLFIKVISLAIVPIAVLMFFNNFNAFDLTWDSLTQTGGFWATLFSEDSFGPLSMTMQRTAAVVIGMIPSGLFLLTSVALSVGMIRLAKHNTLVQDMYSLEMLARVDVLCLDKTGTITDGRMTVSECIPLQNELPYAIETIIGSMSAALNDSNQTALALRDRFGQNNGLQALATLPFSSARKLSAVTFKEAGTYVMGAPEFVLKPMPKDLEESVKAAAKKGLRVLLIAHASGEIQGDQVPENLTPIAMITLADNIRPEAIDTIQWFKDNEVAVKVISGDNPITVAEVAKRAGIENADNFISLEGLSKVEVENAATKYTVFGRVSPEQKAILIKAMKKAGCTVAMTGDGVNDILAMKEADCAISVAAGSDAARNVSNLVLQDNNFASMPKIVNEGRRVINNIKDSASIYIMKTFMILILSLTCILTNCSYFFTTSNMMLYEFFISAIPSFVITLQPNTNRVKGKFIPFVLSRALPGALTLVSGILTIFILHKTPLALELGLIDAAGEDTMQYTALMTIVLTFIGLVMLCRICQPFNRVRAVLFGATVFCCVLVFSVPMLGNVVYTGWSELTFTMPQILLLVVILLASIPVSHFLIKAFDLINPIKDE